MDNVNGQTLPFARQEIERADIRVEITDRRGGLVDLRITGATRAVADGEWRMGRNIWTPRGKWPRTIDAELLGFATFDNSREQFVAFEMVALLDWHGPSWLNGRHNSGDGRVGTLFTLNDGTPQERVAPTFIDLYEASWLTRPRTAAP